MTDNHMKVTVLGGGHIGGACIRGWVSAGGVDIVVTARSEATLRRYDGFPVKVLTDNVEAVKGADVVVIAVKTAQVSEVAEQIRETLDCDRQIVACMAAQVTPDQMAGYLMNSSGKTPALAYVIPNTAAEFRDSVTFISDVTAGPEGVETLRELFSLVGDCFVVGREMLPAGISLASCGTGYAVKYICAAVRGGMELGFTHEEAVRIVNRTVSGATRVVEAHGFNPEDEVRKVATPGGLTERGLAAMDEGGFTQSVCDGLKASTV